jgi:syntaxin 5
MYYPLHSPQARDPESLFLPFFRSGDSFVVAKRKTLFDDKSVEISELIYVIKHDIAELNSDIAALQAFVKQKRGNTRVAKGNRGSELNEHSDNVVVLLQSKLANTSMGFKEVLEIRTQVQPLSFGLGC